MDLASHIIHMELLKIFFGVLLSLWFLEFFVFKDQQRKEEQPEKDISLLLIQGVFVICIAISYFISPKIQWGPQLLIQEFGLFLMANGILIRYWSYTIMKEYYTRSIHPLKERPLLSHGPYRITRHPFHTGLFLITIGLSLFISQSWFVLAAVFPLMGGVLYYRMTLEEQQLHQKYGDIYLGWRRHRV